MIVGVENKGEISIQAAGKTGTKTMTKTMTGKTGMKMKTTIKTITALMPGTRLRTKKRMTMITMRIMKTTRTNIRMAEDNTDDTKTMMTEEEVAESREIIIGKRLTGTMIAIQTTTAQEAVAVVPAAMNAPAPHALALHVQNPGTQEDNIVTAKVDLPGITAATMGIPAVLAAADMEAVVQSEDSTATAKVVLRVAAVAIMVIHPAAVRPAIVHREEVPHTAVHREEVHRITVHPAAVHLVTEVHLAEAAPPVRGAVHPAKKSGPFGFVNGPFFYF